jgi:hypothetical protein
LNPFFDVGGCPKVVVAGKEDVDFTFQKPRRQVEEYGHYGIE